jgi:alpha-tubulin suppressor-like RCC1 family protein
MSSRRLYCFGESSHGQLGICVPNNTTITVPVLVIGAPMRADTGIGTAVVDVACGSQHSLFRTDDGEVWSCGSNDAGQLGRSGDNNSFSKYM